MQYHYKEIWGKCRDCIGCNRLELPEFDGLFRCSNYIQYIKKRRKGEYER